jgi:hypothetical protein
MNLFRHLLQFAALTAILIASQGAMIFDPYKVGPNAVSTSFLAANTDATDTNTYSFASQSMGAVENYRRSVVGVWFRGAGSLSISSVTLGGQTMSLIGTAGVNTGGGNTTYTGWFGLNTGVGTALAASTSATVVVSLSGTASRAGIANYRVIKAGTNLTATDTATSTVDDPTVQIDSQAGGSIMGIFGTSDSAAGNITWTNLTEDFDADVEGRIFSGAHDDFGTVQTNRSITVTPTVAISNPALAVIALGNS